MTYDGFIDEETLKSQQYIYEGDLLDQKSDVSIGSLIMSFIRQLRPGMDVTRIQAPIYILKPRSYLEMTSAYVHPTNDLIKVGSDPDPESRIRTIVAWCLGNLSKTAQKGFSSMKPYNPILGEKFYCKFEHPDSTTEFKAEQVSHHPPISALVMENREHNLVYTSTTYPISTFWGNRVDMAIDGEHFLHILDLDEKYAIAFPPIIARGIILGSSVVEHNGMMTVVCEKTGYRADIEFQKKWYLNYVDGYISKDGCKVARVCGTLDKPIAAVDVMTKKERPLFDPVTVNSVKRIVRPVHEQAHNESQRVWHPLTFALVSNDLDLAAEKKHTIEEWQRRLRREREERGEEWEPEEFVPTGAVTELGTPIFRHIEESLTLLKGLTISQNGDRSEEDEEEEEKENTSDLD